MGTGVNDVERKTIDERLNGNSVEQKPAPAKYVAPRCYKVTGAKKERPDVWVKDPSRSIVLQVTLLIAGLAGFFCIYILMPISEGPPAHLLITYSREVLSKAGTSRGVPWTFCSELRLSSQGCALMYSKFHIRTITLACCLTFTGPWY